MATKPKARGSGAKKKAPKESQKEQSERFIKTARDMGASEDKLEFERAFAKIINRRRTPSEGR